MVHYKLTYFPVRGRVEFIRYILAQADVDYENVTISREDWPNKKPTMPFGKMPVLEVDGKQLSQSLSIGRFLADRYNLSGSIDWNKAYANMIVHCIEDIYHHFIPFINATKENDDKAKADAWQRFKENVSMPLFERFEKMLGSKQWFCDNELTWADLYVAEMCDRVHSCFDKTFVPNYPHLQDLMKRVHSLPNVRKYIDKRPAYTF